MNKRGMLKKIPLLKHDNAPPHKSHIAQEAIRNCGFKQAEHPTYSPDLAPVTFIYFLLLSKHYVERVLTKMMPWNRVLKTGWTLKTKNSFIMV